MPESQLVRLCRGDLRRGRALGSVQQDIAIMSITTEQFPMACASSVTQRDRGVTLEQLGWDLWIGE